MPGMPQRKDNPEKIKYVLFESAVLLEETTEEGIVSQRIYDSKELVKVNESMINVFTANVRIFANIPVCSVKFIECNEDGEIRTANWHVDCTLDQAKRNIELVHKTLCEFLGDRPTSEKIEL